MGAPIQPAVMLLVLSAIFAFVWLIAVARGVTYSGYIHISLVLSLVLTFLHYWLPNRAGHIAQSCPDPRNQRNKARLLGKRPDKR
jgi:membrane protein implicated in regulation of membrane protease activity